MSARSTFNSAVITFRYWYQSWAFLTSSYYQIIAIVSWRLKLSVCCCIDYHVPSLVSFKGQLWSSSKYNELKASLTSCQLTKERLEQYGDAFQRWGVPDILRLFAIIDTQKQKIRKLGQNQ
jgi:hypothetical protein